MASALLSCLLLFVLSFGSISAQLLCRDRPDLKREKCDEYFQKGGIKTMLQDLKTIPDFNDALRAKFLDTVASVSDEYVILTVTSAQVVMTDVQENAGQVEVSYFVLNPSGSENVPTAFRSEELFLMMTLNDDKVETLFGQAVKPVDPNPETLPIPVWAIAIMVYAGLVVLCAGALYATRDWRKLRQQNLERSLQMESVEKGYNTDLPMTDINKNGSDEKAPVVACSEAGVQTSASFRAKAKAAKKAMAMEKTKVVENNDNAVAMVENDVKTAKVEVEQKNDVPTKAQPPVEESATVEDAGDAKDTDQIVLEEKQPDVDTTGDGVVNQAFDAQEQGSNESDDEGEQVYQITDIDQVDDDGNPIAASDDEDTQF